MNGESRKQAWGDQQKQVKDWDSFWWKRFCQFQKLDESGDLAFTRDDVINFLRSLRDSGKQAWQRLQAVRAIERYRQSFPNASKSSFSLDDVRIKLIDLSAQEKHNQNNQIELLESLAIDPNER